MQWRLPTTACVLLAFVSPSLPYYLILFVHLFDSICIISIYLLDWIVFMFLCFLVCFLASVFPCLVVFLYTSTMLYMGSYHPVFMEGTGTLIHSIPIHSNSQRDEMRWICSILVHSLIRSVPFCILNQGSGFGELALQDDAPRAATIITCVGVPQDERGGERWVFGAKAGGERRCWVEVFVKSKKHVIWGLSWIKLTTPYQGIWHWVFVLSFMSKIIRKWLLFLAFHWRKLDSEPGKQSLSIVRNLKSLTKFGGSNFLRHLVM